MSLQIFTPESGVTQEGTLVTAVGQLGSRLVDSNGEPGTLGVKSQFLADILGVPVLAEERPFMEDAFNLSRVTYNLGIRYELTPSRVVTAAALWGASRQKAIEETGATEVYSVEQSAGAVHTLAELRSGTLRPFSGIGIDDSASIHQPAWPMRTLRAYREWSKYRTEWKARQQDNPRGPELELPATTERDTVHDMLGSGRLWRTDMARRWLIDIASGDEYSDMPMLVRWAERTFTAPPDKIARINAELQALAKDRKAPLRSEIVPGSWHSDGDTVEHVAAFAGNIMNLARGNQS